MAAPVLDLYAPLSHKEPLAKGARAKLAPSWVPEDHWRRLTAYKILASYGLNVSREFFSGPGVTEDDKAKRREYGDADLLVDRIRAGVLGDEPEIVVEGADVDPPDEPDLPPLPEQPGTEGQDAQVRRRIFDAQMARWREQAEAAVDEWEQTWAELPALQERQEWLRDWADDEGYWSKLHEGEGDTVELGDGVYTLAWSSEKQRPVMTVYDPGFYFPVLETMGSGDDYPTKVHVAWEFTEDNQQFIRRLTWEQVELPGGEARSYPWSDEPSNLTCLFSDGTWEMKEIGPNGLFDLSDGAATWAETEDGVPANGVDLMHDFLPVIHVPNTPASRTHFGASALLVVSQLLDDIHRSDTNVQAAADLSAGPMVHVSGAGGEDELRIRPGTLYKTSKDGRMTVLDLSAGLAQLMASGDSLRDLFSVNGRVPKSVLGRLAPGEIKSGVHLALTFSPFSQLVGAFRMTRAPKHSLILKFVQRLAQLGQVLPPGENPRASLAFGSFLPSDLAAVVSEVAALLQAHVISTQTAVARLVDAGYTIDDARGEVQRIRYENPASAKDLADATGSEQAAAEFLGIEVEAPAAPQIELPGEAQPPGEEGQT